MERTWIQIRQDVGIADCFSKSAVSHVATFGFVDAPWKLIQVKPTGSGPLTEQQMTGGSSLAGTFYREAEWVATTETLTRLCVHWWNIISLVHTRAECRERNGGQLETSQGRFSSRFVFEEPT